jgi:predicted lipid-binding transport protein (Tim44 family)
MAGPIDGTLNVVGLNIAPKALMSMLSGVQQGFQSIVTTIVILAMIFALVALRLFAVLGRRTGHEQRQLPTPADDRTAVPPRPAPSAGADARADGARDHDSAVAVPAQSGLRALIAMDRSFDVSQFLIGARGAYGMILEAYWSGDRDTLKRFCDPVVFGAFDGAITEREAQGQKLENRLVRIEGAHVSDARIEDGRAFVTVRFEADISAVTKDRDGQMIAGSLVDAVPTVEHWTFVRDVKSRDPNWILAETD